MDKLFLLKTSFQDPKFPGRFFFCWHCALIEGLLATHPLLLKEIQVFRIDWPRPRKEIISEVGPTNQSLPLLVLREGKSSKHETGIGNDRSFISDKDAILRYLVDEFGIPEIHP